MTVGELAHFFNTEYKIGCKLEVVEMKGWKRGMTFDKTGLTWVPTSPYIPEDDTPFFYPTTGIIGLMSFVNIGIGYTLPFKIVGAPWIKADLFAKHLNAQNFPGVIFYPYHFKPFYGLFSGKDCHGVRIHISDPATFKPVSTQFLIMGILKSLYPHHFIKALNKLKKNSRFFNLINGTTKVLEIMEKKKYITWPLQKIHQKERKAFLKKRKKYLIAEYSR
jgi:uncharacterized protein YbbC (DUF1343 family)